METENDNKISFLDITIQKNLIACHFIYLGNQPPPTPLSKEIPANP
jgi:hypothetical protein